MKQKLRVGVIGVGNVGSAHANALYKGEVENALLSALCDNDGTRAEALKKEYPSVPVFEDSEALLRSGLVDAVVVATPHYDHPVISMNAFSYGIDVLSEKPAGVYCQNVKEAVNAAKAKGRVYAVMFNQRMNTLYRRAHDIVQKGELGSLKRILWSVTNWYRTDAYYRSSSWRATWRGEGGGVLMNQAPHNLDLLQWICGMPESLYAHCTEGRFHSIEVEDEATLILRYKNGAEGIFITSTGDYPGTNRLEITGTKGTLVIENGKMIHKQLSIDEREFVKMPENASNPVFITEYRDEPYNGHLMVMQAFVRASLYGEYPVATAEEAINELTLSNAAYLSAWKGETVSLPISDEEYLSYLNKKREGASINVGTSSSNEHGGEYHPRWNTKW